MNLKIENQGEIVIISLNEMRFTNLYASEFRDKVQSLIDDGNIKLILNLSKVNYMDSSGLGAIISCYNHLNDYNKENETTGKIVVCSLSTAVASLFSMLRANEFIGIYNDVNDAKSTFI